MDETIINKINHLVDDYRERLAEKNIVCTVRKKFFTISVNSRHIGIDHALAYENEKNKFHFQPNRYYCIVIKISPLEKNLLKKDFCREYSYVLNKVERIYIGERPKKYQYKEEKILYKVENLIQKILKKAETQSAIEICKDNWCDIFRYMQYKYAYKKKVLGKDLYFWDILLALVILAITIVALIWIYF